MLLPPPPSLLLILTLNYEHSISKETLFSLSETRNKNGELSLPNLTQVRSAQRTFVWIHKRSSETACEFLTANTQTFGVIAKITQTQSHVFADGVTIARWQTIQFNSNKTIVVNTVIIGCQSDNQDNPVENLSIALNMSIVSLKASLDAVRATTTQ